jgi:hypothetical protein
VEQSLVQILVVVANIQMRTLKTEVEKGSARTVIDCGSVGPKKWVNSCSKVLHSQKKRINPVFVFFSQPTPSKGNQVNIPELELALEKERARICVWRALLLTFESGDAKELGDVGKGPGKSFLFLLTLGRVSAESICSAKQTYRWKS